MAASISSQMAGLDSLALEEVCHAVRAFGHFFVGVLRLTLGFAAQPQRRLAIGLRIDIEPVARPVEVGELGPAKFAEGRLVIVPVVQQNLAGGEELIGSVHNSGWAEKRVIHLAEATSYE